MRAQYPAQARLVDKDARIAELEEEVERLREDHDGGCENCEQLREDADLLGAKVDVYEAEAEEYKDRIRHLQKPTLIEENATLRARLERAIEPGSPEAKKISEVLVWAAKHFRARIVDLDADQRSIVKAKDEEIERLREYLKDAERCEYEALNMNARDCAALRARIVDLDADQRSIVKAKDEEIERLREYLKDAERCEYEALNMNARDCAALRARLEKHDALLSVLCPQCWEFVPKELRGGEE